MVDKLPPPQLIKIYSDFSGLGKVALRWNNWPFLTSITIGSKLLYNLFRHHSNKHSQHGIHFFMVSKGNLPKEDARWSDGFDIASDKLTILKIIEGCDFRVFHFTMALGIYPITKMEK